jgi:hypothetical protein
MKHVSVLLVIISFSISGTGCTHTATFMEPNEKTKTLSPATNRNFENFSLERELAYSRTSQIMCAVGGLLGAFFTLGTLSDESVERKNNRATYVSSGLTFTTAGFACAKYFEFISDRAAVYLNAAGVKVEL